MKNYNTKQKDLIIDLIKSKNNSFTVKDIYNELNQKIGLTTIYRMISKLVSNNTLEKYIGNDNTTYYIYLENCNKKNHFYLKCINCGNLIHIDCDCIIELTNHILKSHKFETINNKIIFNGLCHKCR